MEKGLELSPNPPNRSKVSEKYCPAYIYELTEFGGLMSCGSNDIFKNAPCLMY